MNDFAGSLGRNPVEAWHPSSAMLGPVQDRHGHHHGLHAHPDALKGIRMISKKGNRMISDI